MRNTTRTAAAAMSTSLVEECSKARLASHPVRLMTTNGKPKSKYPSFTGEGNARGKSTKRPTNTPNKRMTVMVCC